jgi:2-polyprenyl-3-methyl-5-hydroxy-6-metoxy-1,4-benzoquinol methylase
VTGEQATTAGGHLGYYQQYGISPVRYQMEDVEAHFDRRDSLYRSLGLPPVAFRGVRVLEVAPGSGENSLYVASCGPASYDLVEPNPKAIEQIRAAYDCLKRSHNKPSLRPVRFEGFGTDAVYDIAICENWLGSLPHEIELIRKLASLVTPGGVLVMTFTPTSGLFANIMRRLLSLRIVDPARDFEQKTDQLISVYRPHLATISGMTRSVRDWVQDCMLNPHYFNIVIPLETVLEAVAGEMELLATFPRFTPDWRWFKTLTGSARRFNEITLEAYRENLHNFIDYRKTWKARSASANTRLEAAFRGIHRAAIGWQSTLDAGDPALPTSLVAQISACLADIVAELAKIDSETSEAIAELKKVWDHSKLNAALVRDMKLFSRLFGRETPYVSFTRPRAA